MSDNQVVAPDTNITKYRLIFLPETEYKIISKSIMPNLKQKYAYLIEKGIENFSIGNSLTVFIPDKYRENLSEKAEKGEVL